jgi:hypothetical protein
LLKTSYDNFLSFEWFRSSFDFDEKNLWWFDTIFKICLKSSYSSHIYTSIVSMKFWILDQCNQNVKAMIFYSRE